MRYTVLVFEAEPDEGGYWAKVVEWPGCYTSGKTLDEVRLNAVDAIETWLDAFGTSQDERPQVAATLAVEVGAASSREL